MRILPAAAVLAATLLAGSCIGPMNAFRSLGSWNSRVSDSKYLNAGLGVLLWIVPVYEAALVGDVLLFNSIDFWSGKNPIPEPEPFKPQNPPPAGKSDS